MPNLNPSGPARPHPAVAALADRYGLWRVLLAVLAEFLRRAPARRPAPPEGLSDHLRRDIGLRPRDPGRPPWPPPF